MEQNKTENNFIKILINSLKGKKNWFLISTVIILVTTLLVPSILKADAEFFIMFGVFELFAIVYLNCLIDNNFLHNDSKLAYYLSKPITLKKQIWVNISSNVIMTVYLLILIAFSILFHNLNKEMYEIFKLFVPWLFAGILLASLSAILSGNTLMAGVMTIFNFVLPLIIYLIIMFVFTILENIVLGFNANVLMEMLTNSFYKLDYLYFIKYSESPVDLIYVILLAVILTALVLILNKCIKRRKNENTGNFIVFDGYKYFVSVIASLILPAAFSSMSYGEGITGKIIVSIVLAMLSYYIIVAVLEKSFKISGFSLKLFAMSMAVFIVLTSGTIIFANKYKNVVPNADDVKMAYIGNNSYILNSVNDYLEDEKNERNDGNDGINFYDIQYKYGISLFNENESIKSITDLHRELLSNQNYNFGDSYYMSNVVIAYWMKDGSFIIRNYPIKGNDENKSEANKVKDEIAKRLINSQELKKLQYSYLYDENYYKNNNFYFNVRKSSNGEAVLLNMNLNDIREYLIKDIDKTFVKGDNAFNLLIFDGRFYGKEAIETNSNSYYIDIMEKDADGLNQINEIYVNEDFKNTNDYLKNIIK